MSKKVKIFAYGSNMCTQWLRDRVSSAEPLGRAKLPNKRLVCNKKSKDGSGKANLEDATDTVWGVLYKIDSAQLDKLDECEKGYERECLEVLTEKDSSERAWVYIASKPTRLTSDPRPYDWYKELMMKGAREHQLPQFYIKRMGQIESKPDPKCRSKYL